MVRPVQTGRSRGCAVCRRKKIKCDLREPECQRCLNAGVSCPGPIQGPIILMAGKSGSPATITSVPEAVEVKLPPSTQAKSLQQSANKSILLSTFVQYLAHSARRSSWTLCLPSMATNNSSSTIPFRSALNALTLVYFAHASSDVDFSRHASREYGRALSLHRQSLARLPASPRLPSEVRSSILSSLKQALLTSVILSYYELIAAFNPLAWASHTEACERLLTLIGTDIISENVFVRQLAVTVRSHSILRTAVYGYRTIFAYEPWISASQRWIQAQEQSISRDAYDWVAEFVLRLSRHVRESDTIEFSGESQISSGAKKQFLEELEANYADFVMSLEPPIFPSSLPLFSRPEGPQEPTALSLVLPGALRRQFPSMAFAYFHAAALLFRHHFAQEFPDPAYNVQWITRVGEYLEGDSRTNATGVLRMGFPFAIAWKRATGCDEEVRLLARGTFERWSGREGMTGLSVVAFG